MSAAVLSNKIEITTVELALARVPPAMEGLRIAHLSDLHIREPRRRHDQIIDILREQEADLIAVTGDVMHRPGHEPAAVEFLERLVRQVKPRHGYLGCFGNHDTTEFKRRAGYLPIHWLTDSTFDHPDLPLRVSGLDCQYHREQVADPMRMLQRMEEMVGDRLTVLLAHMPHWLPVAASLGFDLMLSGHTHGGQCRLPTGHAIYNATANWPLELTSGIVGMGSTTAVISRGLGESNLEGLRMFCRPMVDILTLRRDADASPHPGLPTLITKW